MARRPSPSVYFDSHPLPTPDSPFENEDDPQHGHVLQPQLSQQQLRPPVVRNLGEEDSFAAHLRDQCAPDGPNDPVLGGFASLGLIKDPEIEGPGLEGTSVPTHYSSGTPHSASPGTSPGAGAQFEHFPYHGPAPVSPALVTNNPFGGNRVVSSSEARAWGFLQPKTNDPMETLDLLSIEDMGLHAIDMGSAADWQGCVLENQSESPEAASWAIARHMRKRQNKWVVVPACSMQQMPAERSSAAGSSGVSNGSRPATAGSSECSCIPRSVVVSTVSSQRAHHQRDEVNTAESESTFCGRHTFELRFLGNDALPPTMSVTLSNEVSLEPEGDIPAATVTELRSLSGASAATSRAGKSRGVEDADLFAPSLRAQPGPRGFADVVEWPSARPAPSTFDSDLLSSLDQSRRPSLGKSVSHESIGVTLQQANASIAPTSMRNGGRSSVPSTPQETALAEAVADPNGETGARVPFDGLTLSSGSASSSREGEDRSDPRLARFSSASSQNLQDRYAAELSPATQSKGLPPLPADAREAAKKPKKEQKLKQWFRKRLVMGDDGGSTRALKRLNEC